MASKSALMSFFGDGSIDPVPKDPGLQNREDSKKLYQGDLSVDRKKIPRSKKLSKTMPVFSYCLFFLISMLPVAMFSKAAKKLCYKPSIL
jgi:hypothetical protein